MSTTAQSMRVAAPPAAGPAPEVGQPVARAASRGRRSLWARLLRNPLTAVSLAFLVVMHVLVFAGPLAWSISPEQTSALDALLPPGPPVRLVRGQWGRLHHRPDPQPGAGDLRGSAAG